MTIPEAFQTALQHQQNGRLAEAEAIYRQILVVEPTHPDALHHLGIMAHQAGRNDVAADLILQAIAAAPTASALYSNLGTIYRKLGRPGLAIGAYGKALELNPDLAEAHYNLGNVFRDQGQFCEATAAYRRAIQLKPGYAEAHNNLGLVLRDQGQLTEATAAYCRAIDLRPDNAAAHNNLGAAFAEQGRLDEAMAAYRRAIQLKPDYAEAHNNLGNALMDQGEFDDAITAYHRAIQLKPDYADTHKNLGRAFMDQGLLDEARAAYRHTIQLRPEDAEAHSSLLCLLHYLPNFDAALISREHCRWNEVHARPLLNSSAPQDHDADPKRRLRVGYVSPDFCQHSVAFFFEGLLANHDRSEVEVYCYADLSREDAVSQRLRSYSGQWHTIAGMRDEQVAELIRRNGIDILVDLAGHTANNRLLVFARKPAPIQITYLGYCGTTGMGAMDYRLTDAYADPPGATEHLHTETLIRLPDTFACFRPPVDCPPVQPLPALMDGHVTFASFHTLPKLNEPLLDCWTRILLRVPGSRLLMTATRFDEGSQVERLGHFFNTRGIGPDRLEFKKRQSLADYLALHNRVDVLLDSHPFTGHTTCCLALWMGVPVVTLAGQTHCARMVGSVLNTLGLPELIARTPEEYVKIACELAGNPSRRAHLRAMLRERMRTSPLTDEPRFARNVEQAYRQMWHTWCARQCSNDRREHCAES